jgi:DNA-binding NtrC family response regulator
MSPTDPANDQTLRILLIEDDLDTQANLHDILSLDGHSILLAGTALEGRRIAKEKAPDVVILDRQLPDANADQLLPDLRKLMPAGDIVIVTGFADIESTIAALRFGASDYILKPVNPDALRASLERIVQRRRIERELRSEQQFAERVVKTAEAVVLVLDLDGKIIDFNPQILIPDRRVPPH